MSDGRPATGPLRAPDERSPRCDLPLSDTTARACVDSTAGPKLSWHGHGTTFVGHAEVVIHAVGEGLGCRARLDPDRRASGLVADGDAGGRARAVGHGAVSRT